MQRGFYEWLRPQEDMLIFAHLLHEHDTGAAGMMHGKKCWQNGEPDEYPLAWTSLTSVSGGAYQLYYSDALEEMSIGFAAFVIKTSLTEALPIPYR
jgi:hypothetical protein